MSIEIEIKLYHAIRRYMPPGHGDSYSQRLSLPAGASVAQVMATLNIPQRIPVLIFLRSKMSRPDKVLANGDVLSIMQPAGGG